MRALGVVRLSSHSKKVDDPSTSPKRQRGHVLDTASHRGDTIVAWAEDLNVSARKVPPWLRPQLGLWLPDLSDETSPKGGQPDKFDAIYFWKLDRLVRSVGDFAKVLTWATAAKKNLVSSDGAVDLSTPMGKAMAQIAVVFAELEAGIIQERVEDARRELLSQGRWTGGRYPYGYMPVKDPEGGWRLVKDPEVLPILEELINRILKKESINSIALDFDTRKIPTPRGGKSWTNVNFGTILRSKNLLGQFMMEEEVEGIIIPVTIQRAEPLIDMTTYTKLQKVMSDYTPRRQAGASMLLEIGYCALCGSKMHSRTFKRPARNYQYYTCAGRNSRVKNGCEAEPIRGDALEAGVKDVLLSNIGNLEIFETIEIGGEDRTAELKEAEAKLADLLVISAGQTEGVKKHLAPQIESLTALVEDLSRVPITEGDIISSGTGLTYREQWESSDPTEQRNLLLGSGIRVYVARGNGKPLSIKQGHIPEGNGVVIGRIYDGIQILAFIPEDIAQRMTNKPQELPYQDQTIWEAQDLRLK